jgi:hypothetical protein
MREMRGSQQVYRQDPEGEPRWFMVQEVQDFRLLGSLRQIRMGYDA